MEILEIQWKEIQKHILEHQLNYIQQELKEMLFISFNLSIFEGIY